MLFFQTHFSSLNTLSLLSLLLPWDSFCSKPDPLSCFFGLWSFSPFQFSYRKASLFSIRTKRGFIRTNYLFPYTPICNFTVFERDGEEGRMLFLCQALPQDAKLHFEDHNRQLLIERRNAVRSPIPFAPLFLSPVCNDCLIFRPFLLPIHHPIQPEHT